MDVAWNARDKTAEDLVFACARGELAFSGPNSLWTAFNERGWNTRYLYEAVRNAEFHLEAQERMAREEAAA